MQNVIESSQIEGIINIGSQDYNRQQLNYEINEKILPKLPHEESLRNEIPSIHSSNHFNNSKTNNNVNNDSSAYWNSDYDQKNCQKQD